MTTNTENQTATSTSVDNAATKTNTPNKSTREFGLLSMIAMVMGIVIGSGIFAKNAGLVGTNGSIYITFAAWAVGAFLVLAIVIAFLELFTMTEKANEQATYANWGRMLINPTFAKIAGIYFIYVNLPISIVTMAYFAGNRIMDVVFVSWMGLEPLWAYFLIRVFVVIALLAYFFTVNGFYTKPGRYLSNIGTSVKVIPLAFVFFLFVIMMMVDIGSLNPIFSKDFNDALGETSGIKNDGISGLLVFAATMPAIIFVFDGFLTSGSLSKEAKNPNTYRSAVLIGIIAITVVYFTYSFGVFSLGDPFTDTATGASLSWNEYQALSDTSSIEMNGNYGEINNAILAVWENAGWLADIITLIVAISIITSVSGITMSCMRGVADMSANNFMADPEGKAITRNAHNSLPGAMKTVMLLSIGYLAIDTALDAIAIPSDSWTQATDYHLTAGSDFFSNLTSVGSFIIMAILLGGGLRNRKTGRVESEKFRVFVPAAIIAISTLAIIVVIYVLQIFWFSTSAAYGSAEYWNYVRMYTVQIVVAIIWVVATPLWFVYLNSRTSKLSKEQLDAKQIIIDNYKN